MSGPLGGTADACVGFSIAVSQDLRIVEGFHGQVVCYSSKAGSKLSASL